MYDKVSTKLEFVNREQKVLDFWKENQVFEKSVEETKDLPTYTFYDGPPTANGKPHIGHVLTERPDGIHTVCLLSSRLRSSWESTARSR